ncbi:hypothetical protein [Photobacterium nomapromontoriensis]|uniref:hypothetical protein n=1 Tax=Photobacterium nomapromontoriensis TaxID=2910237 RepID=UPI003D11C11D
MKHRILILAVTAVSISLYFALSPKTIPLASSLLPARIVFSAPMKDPLIVDNDIMVIQDGQDYLTLNQQQADNLLTLITEFDHWLTSCSSTPQPPSKTSHTAHSLNIENTHQIVSYDVSTVSDGVVHLTTRNQVKATTLSKVTNKYYTCPVNGDLNKTLSEIKSLFELERASL